MSFLDFFKTRADKPSFSDDPAEIRRVYERRRWSVFLSVLFGYGFFYTCRINFSVAKKSMLDDQVLTATQMGLIGSVGGFGNVAFNLFLGHLNPRLGFILGQGFVGLAALMFWWGNLPFWYALGYFMFGGYRVARLLIFAQVRAFIHQAQMGLAYGLTETANSLGVILSPLLAGYIYERDPALIYPLTLGLILFAIFVSMILIPRPAHPEHIPLMPEN